MFSVVFLPSLKDNYQNLLLLNMIYHFLRRIINDLYKKISQTGKQHKKKYSYQFDCRSLQSIKLDTKFRFQGSSFDSYPFFYKSLVDKYRKLFNAIFQGMVVDN
jgi:hypothetical protein